MKEWMQRYRKEISNNELKWMPEVHIYTTENWHYTGMLVFFLANL